MNDQFDLILEEFRSGKIKTDDFDKWLSQNLGAVSVLLSRSAFLKLKQGDPTRALLERLGSGCSCSNIYKTGPFRSSSEFDICMAEVDKAKASGAVSATREPGWVKPDKKEIGGAGFYECSNCHAIWKVLSPERAFLGEWNRIA
ncbi:MAG: hypothetical protein K6L76_01240 [Agarilytica sp.]